MTIKTRIEQDPDTGLHVLPVPEKPALSLKKSGHRRILVTLEKTTYRRALLNTSHGDHFIIFGKRTLAIHGLALGDPVTIILEVDPEPDRIEVPEELEEALNQNPAALKRWDTLTPGKQRSLCYHVEGAKRQETRARRAVDIAEKIRTHQLYWDK